MTATEWSGAVPVWKVTEIHKGRKGELRDGAERSYTRVFRVHTNSKLDGPVEAMFAVDPNTAESVPALYSSYQAYSGSEFDLLALCRKINPVQDDDDWTIWTVTCEYSTESTADISNAGPPADGAGNPSSGSGASADPTLEPPVQEWQSWSQIVAQDREPDVEVFGLPIVRGKPIWNSAFDPYNPAPTREIGGDILLIERNEFSYDRAAKAAFRYTVNSGDFVGGGDAGRWLCMPIQARRAYKGALKYWRVRYEFHHAGDLETWDHVLLDAGFNIVNAFGAKWPILPAGQRASLPWPLNGSGMKLTVEELDEAAATGDHLVYNTFQKYAQKDFSGLGLTIEN